MMIEKPWFIATLPIRWGLYVINFAVLAVIVPFVLKTVLRKPHLIWIPGAWMCRNALRIFSIRLSMNALATIDRSKQTILIANHKSWFDNLVLQAVYPGRLIFAVKQDYLKFPLVRSVCRINNYVPIAENCDAFKTLSKTVQSLKQNEALLIYPEGTRYPYPGLLPFKKGASTLARKHGAQIIPAFIHGAEHVLSKNRTIWSIRPQTIHLHFAKPLDAISSPHLRSPKALEHWYQSNYQLFCEKQKGQ